MSHWNGVKYTFKLNEEHVSYQEILDIIRKESEKTQQEYISNGFPNNDVVVRLYKENDNLLFLSEICQVSPIDLSKEVMKKIKENIDTNMNKYYFYKQDHGEEKGVINQVYGYAEQIVDYLWNAGYVNPEERTTKPIQFQTIYKKQDISKFLECINDEKKLQQMICDSQASKLKIDTSKSYKM